MSFELQVNTWLHIITFLNDHLKRINVNKKNFVNLFSKFSLAIYVLVEELSNHCDYFLSLSEFTDLLGKAFSHLDFSIFLWRQCKHNNLVSFVAIKRYLNGNSL